MDIYREIELDECPFCGGAGLLEEDTGWGFYAICQNCGSQTVSIAYHHEAERKQAAEKAAYLWNSHKIIKENQND